MFKIISLFLIFIAVLAMLGRLRWPGRAGGAKRMRGLKKPRICPQCGRYNLRGGPCRHCDDEGQV